MLLLVAFNRRSIQNPSANRQKIFEKCSFRSDQHPRHRFRIRTTDTPGLKPFTKSKQNPPNRSNSPFRATETTIHNNWGRFAFISTFNLDILRYNFTIVRVFNIFPYISLYFEQTTRLAACAGLLWLDLKFSRITFTNFDLSAYITKYVQLKVCELSEVALKIYIYKQTFNTRTKSDHVQTLFVRRKILHLIIAGQVK